MSSDTLTTCHAAVIPAKRHSSRCPDKNWLEFAGGASLTDLALASLPGEVFSSVILSTDHPDYHPPLPCEVHRRDASTATVEADVQDLLRGIIEQYRLHDVYVWLLNPTSPFRDRQDFERISRLIEQTDCPAVVSVSPVSPFLWKGDEPMFATSGRRRNTQDAGDEYCVENGMFYVFRGADFLDAGTWYLPGVQRYVQPGVTKAIDIDTPEDFREARSVWAAVHSPGSAMTPASETFQNETLAIEDLIAPPVADHLTLAASHIRRYVLASEGLNVCPSDRVLDASCGKGYGSHLLSLAAGSVVGLDVNPEYLSEARRLFAADNLQFMHYDEYFAERNTPADKLVCIETYEHLPPAELPVFLERLLGALRTGGDAFLTCPLGDDGPSTVNEFHLNEPSLATLHEQFAPRFAMCSFKIARRKDSFGQVGDYCCATLTGYRGDSSR